MSHLLHDYEQAMYYVDRAVRAGPNCAMAWLMSSATRGYLDQGAEAVRHAQRGLALSPLDAHLFWPETLLAQAYYVDGQFDRASALAERVAVRRPDVMGNLRLLAKSQLGASPMLARRRSA